MKQLRDYQEQAIQSIFNYFGTKAGNPVLALPTGTGKALIIAAFVKKALEAYSKQKILVATHVRELIHQNYLEFLGEWPEAPAGIYSAGLKRKDVYQNVIFCGVASIAKNIMAFGRVDLFLVDECHLISPNEETMYMKVIAMLKSLNPQMKVIGFTATPWRQGVGSIINEGIFTDICFNVTDMASFNRFIAEGYLVPLVSKPTNLILDTSGVRLLAGDFNEKQLDLVVNKDNITWSALQETMCYAYDRHSWLVFATSLDHADKIRQMLEYLKVSCRVVHSKMSSGERDLNIKEWKEGKFTAIINMGVLTTGVNHPALDLIVMLRPTMSTILWVQMLGRGTRPLFMPGFDITTIQGRLASIEASQKQYCRVLDFANNISRLGPVNDPVLPRKKGEKAGEVPIKICDACGAYNHISARFCGGQPYKTVEGCGAVFTFQTQLKQFASTAEIIKPNSEVIVENFPVDHVSFKLHQKAGKPDSLKYTYHCGLLTKFHKYVLIEHEGFLRRKAREWWEKRTLLPFPDTTLQALTLMDQLDVPKYIKVHTNCPFPEVITESFDVPFEEKLVGSDVPF
jgi:DNA repair protein RadD